MSPGQLAGYLIEHSVKFCQCIHYSAAAHVGIRSRHMTSSRRTLLARLAALTAAGASGAHQGSAHAHGGDLVVFAAASLKNALDAINAQWQKERGKKALLSYASSPALAKQIEQGLRRHDPVLRLTVSAPQARSAHPADRRIVRSTNRLVPA